MIFITTSKVLMSGGTRLANRLSQPSCTPARTPRRARVAGATGREAPQPIAATAGVRSEKKEARQHGAREL